MAASSSHDDGAPTGPYQVVARRFRPQTFQEMVGQDEVLQSLRVALQQQRVPHAFLFSGSRGVGKTTSARILARCLNCEKGPTPEPCGQCAACRSILDGSNPDVMEIDAASNNLVDDVRRLRESVGFATMQSRYRVVILDEVHMMTKSAFNAFLKTLEEPPPRVVFVLATTELHKVPETIRSRCQVLLFRRVGETDLVRRLRSIADREGGAVADDLLAEIAGSVRGGVRDAETALERVLPLLRAHGAAFDLAAYRTLVARVGLDATIGVVEQLLQGDAKAGLHFARDLQQHGSDEREALGEIVEVLRWLLLLKIDGADSGLVPVTGALRQRLEALVATAEPNRLDAMVGAGLLGRERLRRLEDRGAVFEVALLRMAQAGALPTLADLLAEVRAGGGAAAPAAVAPTRAAPRFGAAAVPAPGGASGGGGGGAGAALAPRSAAPAAPGTGDLKARTLGLLRDRALLQATFELCKVDGPTAGDVVVVTLHSERKMHQDRLQSPVVQQELAKAVQDAAGRPVKVEFRVANAGSGEAEGALGGGAPPQRHEIGPTAKRVVERFRGRVVQVNPEDRIGEVPPPAAEDDAPPAPLPGDAEG
ncbi:MAG: DNA polymerase III subunit gamma/tau [Planctomycetes bacterium]|nr:DNA polymerase III subunit gamma/tau [Planctomycetota bacterium]